MKKFVVAILAIFGVLSATHQVAKADVLADWTFETSVPAGTGPYSPEAGSGSATAVGLGTISSPAGNGSSHSFSANGWNASTSYYQFQVSTLGLSNIGVSYDQASSATGPGSFIFQYSTDGINFVNYATYNVQINGSPNTPWGAGNGVQSLYNFSFDLTSITDLNNASVIDFRLVDAGTTSANGGTVGSGGTDRVDNFTVYDNYAPVPEPSTLALCGLGLVGGLLRLRRKA